MTITRPETTAATRNLALATLAFGVGFWAWNIIGPLAGSYREDLDLNSTQNSILVAMPVLVGSLGRIPVGALTDRFGGKRMFAVLSFLSVVPVLLVMLAGNASSYVGLLAAAFVLGIAGTSFAAGIPFVNAWYEPQHRGKATGIFGAGMGGTALSAFFTPRFVEWFGYTATHLILMAALIGTGALVLAFMQDSPAWRPNNDPVLPKLTAAARLSVTWQMSFLYAVTFGGFVAFSTYLPTYLKVVYDFSQTDAGTRTAGFALAAVIARPLGGTLSDRLGPRPVVLISLAGAAVLAVVLALKPEPEIPAGTSFVLMAFSLGLGAGGVFTWVAQRSPAARVGAITGIVGAAGGLGGFFPPLAMGATYDEAGNDYAIGLGLLCVTALVTFAFVVLRLRDGRRQQPS